MKCSGRLETILKLQADGAALYGGNHRQQRWGRQPGRISAHSRTAPFLAAWQGSERDISLLSIKLKFLESTGTAWLFTSWRSQPISMNRAGLWQLLYFAWNSVNLLEGQTVACSHQWGKTVHNFSSWVTLFHQNFIVNNMPALLSITLLSVRKKSAIYPSSTES